MDRDRLKGYAANGDDHQRAWADWLRDDDPPATPRPVVNVSPAPTQPSAAPEPDVTIELRLPKLKLPKIDVLPLAKASKRAIGSGRQRLHRPSKKLSLVATGGGLIFVAGYIGLQQLSANHLHQQAAAAAAVVSKNVAHNAAVLSKPTFQPLVPKSEPQLATPQAGHSAFDGSRNSYAFIDNFQQGTVQVSEQPLPAQFKTAAEAAAKVASSLGATATVTTNYGSAFIATQAKSNSQTVVFASDKLLIFIQSPFTYDSLKYQTYINNLQ